MNNDLLVNAQIEYRVNRIRDDWRPIRARRASRRQRREEHLPQLGAPEAEKQPLPHQVEFITAAAPPPEAVLAAMRLWNDCASGQASHCHLCSNDRRRPFCGAVNRDAAGRARSNNGTAVGFAYTTSGCSVDRHVLAGSTRLT